MFGFPYQKGFFETFSVRFDSNAGMKDINLPSRASNLSFRISYMLSRAPAFNVGLSTLPIYGPNFSVGKRILADSAIKKCFEKFEWKFNVAPASKTFSGKSTTDECENVNLTPLTSHVGVGKLYTTLHHFISQKATEKTITKFGDTDVNFTCDVVTATATSPSIPLATEGIDFADSADQKADSDNVEKKKTDECEIPRGTNADINSEDANVSLLTSDSVPQLSEEGQLPSNTEKFTEDDSKVKNNDDMCIIREVLDTLLLDVTAQELQSSSETCEGGQHANGVTSQGEDSVRNAENVSSSPLKQKVASGTSGVTRTEEHNNVPTADHQIKSPSSDDEMTKIEQNLEDIRKLVNEAMKVPLDSVPQEKIKRMIREVNMERLILIKQIEAQSTEIYTFTEHPVYDENDPTKIIRYRRTSKKKTAAERLAAIKSRASEEKKDPSELSFNERRILYKKNLIKSYEKKLIVLKSRLVQLTSETGESTGGDEEKKSSETSNSPFVRRWKKECCKKSDSIQLTTEIWKSLTESEKLEKYLASIPEKYRKCLEERIEQHRKEWAMHPIRTRQSRERKFVFGIGIPGHYVGEDPAKLKDESLRAFKWYASMNPRGLDLWKYRLIKFFAMLTVFGKTILGNASCDFTKGLYNEIKSYFCGEVETSKDPLKKESSV